MKNQSGLKNPLGFIMCRLQAEPRNPMAAVNYRPPIRCPRLLLRGHLPPPPRAPRPRWPGLSTRSPREAPGRAEAASTVGSPRTDPGALHPGAEGGADGSGVLAGGVRGMLAAAGLGGAGAGPEGPGFRRWVWAAVTGLVAVLAADVPTRRWAAGRGARVPRPGHSLAAGRPWALSLRGGCGAGAGTEAGAGEHPVPTRRQGQAPG